MCVFIYDIINNKFFDFEYNQEKVLKQREIMHFLESFTVCNSNNYNKKNNKNEKIKPKSRKKRKKDKEKSKNAKDKRFENICKLPYRTIIILHFCFFFEVGLDFLNC